MKLPPIKITKTKLRRFNIATHRDLGYFFSSLIIVYCLSGIALNHIDDWNPDFIIHKETVTVPGKWADRKLTDEDIVEISKLVGEESYRVYDSPLPGQVKIYYENASFHVHLAEGRGHYERVMRRPIFYQSNLFHRNSISGWKWASDIFAFMLIVINITGLFVLKGKHGLKGRGKWFIAAGALPPIIALILSEYL